MFLIVDTDDYYGDITVTDVKAFITKELADAYMLEHNVWHDVFEVEKPIYEFFVVTAPGANKRTFFSLLEAEAFVGSRKAPHRYTIHPFYSS